MDFWRIPGVAKKVSRAAPKTVLWALIFLGHASTAPAFTVAPYYPLVDGYQWTYQKNGGPTYPRSIAGTTTFNGAQVKSLYDTEDNFYTYLTNDGNGVRQFGASSPSVFIDGCGTTSYTETYSTSAGTAIVFSAAEANLGQSFNTTGQVTASYPACGSFVFDAQFTSQIQAMETITVPLGTFSTVRFQTTATLYYQGAFFHNQVETYWFAQNVGLIQEHYSDSDGFADTYRLVSTNVMRTAPDAFSFTPQNGVAPGTMVTSNAITVTGTTTGSAISVAGGEYSINGGAFTSSVGTVANGQTVQVRQTASGSGSTTTSATLTIGGVSGAFSVTTAAAPADSVPPSVPSLNAVPGPSSASLNWMPSTDNVGVTKYKVYRDGVLIVETAGNVTGYTDTSLAAGATYGYTVAACDAAGNCSAQSTAAVVTMPPAAPTGLTAATIDSSQVHLAWTSASGATGYGVYRDGILIASLGNVTSYDDTGLSPATTYGYTVQACNSVCSAHSAAASATTAPAVPAGLSATGASLSQINLAWSAAAGAATYRVFRNGALVATLGNVTSYADTGLAASTTYNYTVQACDAASRCSAQSAVASGTTTPDTIAPGAPAAPAVVAVRDSQINVSWAAATDNVGVTQYKVSRDGVLRATLGNVTTYADTGLTALTSYIYTVAACDAAGNCSGNSPPASATTLAPGNALFAPRLEPGWNLLGNSLGITIDAATTFGNADAPVSEVSTNVVSVWKWDAAGQKWAFYSPQLSVSGIGDYAASKGYDVLSTIQEGEGYWVNTIGPVSLPQQTGAAVTWTGFDFPALPSGWSLIANSTEVAPNQFNSNVSATPPAPGAVPTENFLSLWAWDAAQAKWFFYSPLLEATGGLGAVKQYADDHFYLHFDDYGKTLGIGTGFWVNRP